VARRSNTEWVYFYMHDKTRLPGLRSGELLHWSWIALSILYSFRLRARIPCTSRHYRREIRGIATHHLSSSVILCTFRHCCVTPAKSEAGLGCTALPELGNRLQEFNL